MRHGRILAVLMFAVTMTVTGAWAQEYPQGPNGEAAPASDGPQPDVARISLIHGDVSTQRGDTGDWAVTSINAPLVGGDQVATGEKSRAEIQLDYANLVRLAARSQVKIADLSRTRIQLQVAQGYANFTQLKGSEAEVEINSPNVAVRLLKHGRYRVQVASDSETDVIVREGEAEITTPQGSTRVKEGQMIQVRGTDNPEYRVAEAPAKDDWDRWNKDRDATIRDAHSWGQTNRYYTGVHDLDSYGHWVYVPGYGQVWRPYYSNAGWAPYQSGRWVWEPYYGWTWVSYEPWGWAPYHYGRWLYYSGNWCWWPGPVYVHYRPVWSPAFVFFVGFGHHSSFGFGNIGWFPVGPHDAYYPWYGRGFNRVNVVNITNINVINVRNGRYIAPLAVRGRHPYYSNVNLVQNNVHVRGAITSVGVEDFGHGNFNNRHHGVQDHEWREARVMTANLPVVPSREHLHVSGGEAHLPVGMQPRNNERFYSRHQPPAAPESFHTQVERVERVVGPQGVNAGNVQKMNGGPEQVDRRDVGGTGNGRFGDKPGSTEAPRVGGSVNGGGSASTGNASHGDGRFGRSEGNNSGNSGNDAGKESSPGGFRRFGNGKNGSDNAGIGPGQNAGPKDSPGRMAPGANEGMVQNNPPANNGSSNNNGNSAQDKNSTQDKRDNRDRGGWSKFSRSGGDNGNNHSDQTSQPAKNDQGHAPRTDNNTSEPRHGNEGPAWQKFPSTGDRPAGGNRTPQPDKSASPAQTPSTHEDHGGWQRFPSNGGRNDSSPNRTETDSGGRSKPPLELHRPIVTPRNENTRDSHNDQRYSPPPPARTPEVHNEPRYNPPPSRSESPRYSPPSQSRSESPRNNPPSHTESHGGGNSSSSHGSSDRGNHSDSKSSSNPKQR